MCIKQMTSASLFDPIPGDLVQLRFRAYWTGIVLAINDGIAAVLVIKDRRGNPMRKQKEHTLNKKMVVCDQSTGCCHSRP